MNQFSHDFYKSVIQYDVSLLLPTVLPIFDPALISDILKVLHRGFSEYDNRRLKTLLTVGKVAGRPLFYNWIGIGLVDAFRQLKKAGVIKRCTQKNLEYWIHFNFTFGNKGRFSRLSLPYISSIISSKKDLCNRPLLDVKVDRSTKMILIVDGRL